MKYLMLLFMVLPSLLLAQKTDRKVHDFGTVESWNNPVATFVVTNTGKTDLVFLPTFPAKDVLVQLPSTPIKPGGSGEVGIQYFTEKKGAFSRSVSLYVGNSDKPLEFTVKGEIRSFAPGALTVCPTVGPKSNDDKMYSQEFQVIDSVTRLPIGDATVKISAPDMNAIQGRTGKDGVVVTRVFVGFYQVEVSAATYKSYYVRGNLAPHQGRIVFELVKAATQEPVVALEPVNVGVTPTPSPTPTPTPVEDEPWIVEPDPEPTPEPTPEPVPTPDEITTDGTLNRSLFKPNNIVFVLDISASMKSPEKLPKLKESMKELVSVLRDIDYITIVTFSRDAKVHVPTTRASNKQYIYDMIDSLTPYSYTNGTKGILMGYDLAQQNFIAGGNNQLIISTDGEFNNPSFSASELLNDIKVRTQQGVILSVVGFGNIPDGKRLMAKMAHSGTGNYIHFGQGDTRRALVDEIRSQSLVTQ